MLLPQRSERAIVRFVRDQRPELVGMGAEAAVPAGERRAREVDQRSLRAQAQLLVNAALRNVVDQAERGLDSPLQAAVLVVRVAALRGERQQPPVLVLDRGF